MVSWQLVRKLLQIFSMILAFWVNGSRYSFAVGQDVPVYDSALAEQELEHNTFSVNGYLVRIVKILDNLANAKNLAEQMADLNELVELQQLVVNACDTSCNRNEHKQVHGYLDKLNQSFIRQFKVTGKTFENMSRGIKDIQQFIVTIPNLGENKVKTAEITAAILQATLKTQQEMQMLQLQRQTFSILQEQKQAVEIKLEQGNTNSVYRGFHDSKL